MVIDPVKLIFVMAVVEAIVVTLLAYEIAVVFVWRVVMFVVAEFIWVWIDELGSKNCNFCKFAFVILNAPAFSNNEPSNRNEDEKMFAPENVLMPPTA